MNNLLKAREITWFLVGFASMMLAFYTYYNENNKKQAGYFAILSFVAVTMFYLRRKQRKELEKEEK